MGINEDLLEHQIKWEDLINQTEQIQKKMLELMIQMRKEIGSLSQLKNKFPESVQIGKRIAQCDQLLEQSSEILNEIKKQLIEYKKQKDSLDEVIKTANESTLQGAAKNMKLY